MSALCRVCRKDGRLASVAIGHSLGVFCVALSRYAAARRTRSGMGSGLLALSRNSMVLKIMSSLPRFSRSWTLYSPGP